MSQFSYLSVSLHGNKKWRTNHYTNIKHTKFRWYDTIFRVSNHQPNIKDVMPLYYLASKYVQVSLVRTRRRFLTRLVDNKKETLSLKIKEIFYFNPENSGEFIEDL